MILAGRGILTSKTIVSRYKLLIRNTELLDFHPARLQQPHGPDTLHGGETVSGAWESSECCLIRWVPVLPEWAPPQTSITALPPQPKPPLLHLRHNHH